MSWIHHLKKVYSLDTLDTRFVPKDVSHESKIDSVKPSPEELKTKQDGGRVSSPPIGAQSSKWKTAEFFLYYIVFIICIPLMFYTPFKVSQGT